MRLVAINTIGLTGAEIIASELARFPDLLMLPGQNFIGFQTRTYRPHDYRGWKPADIFANLNKHHFTRAERIWAGLTKSMSPDMLARYDRAHHEAEFVRLAATATTTIDHFRNFAVAFALANGGNGDGYRQFGFFGNNIIVNASHYPDFLDRAVVVDFTNPIDFWIANIGQRMVWDNLQTIRFWLVNMLLVRRWAQRHPKHYFAVDVRDYAASQDDVRSRLGKFLGFDGNVAPRVPDGFISYSPGIIAAFERNAGELRRIYDGWGEFELGLTFDDWASGFLAAPGIDALLDRYEDFWNTTSHTNLDWAGPVADEIVERCVDFTGVKNRRNLSRWFYHDCFQIHSDDWEHPRGNLEHYLGNLEDEIALPAMATYVRIVLHYIERVADNTIKRAYSALPIRETNLYTRVRALESNFPRWELTKKFAEVEKRIDEADAAIAKFC
jgi:hypothetical protein